MGKKKETDWEADLNREYAQWEYLREYGGSDPFYDDATNMKLVRNHIIYAKMQLEEKYGADMGKYPDIYFGELPPEVEAGYMARAGEIRKRAAEALEIYLSDMNFQYLLYSKEQLNSKEIKETCIENVLGYVSGLARALKKDDLITMRRHAFETGGYQESFADCAEKVKRILNEKQKGESGQTWEEQMTLFQFGLVAGQRR